MEKMTTYTVHMGGEWIKESATEFTSLKKAKDFMKSKHDFCVKWDADILTLVKRDFDTDGDYIATAINTRSTILKG